MLDDDIIRNTMQFFIPHASNDHHVEQLYNATRKFCAEQTGWKVLPTRIYSLRYRHNGNEYYAQVGTNDPIEGLVVCILESEVTYFVCTPNRGVLSGSPILVGREDVSYVELFEE